MTRCEWADEWQRGSRKRGMVQNGWRSNGKGSFAPNIGSCHPCVIASVIPSFFLLHLSFFSPNILVKPPRACPSQRSYISIVLIHLASPPTIFAILRPHFLTSPRSPISVNRTSTPS